MIATILIVAILATIIISSGGVAICVIAAAIGGVVKTTAGIAQKGVTLVDFVNPLRFSARHGVPNDEGFYTRIGTLAGVLSLALGGVAFALPNLIGQGLSYEDWEVSDEWHVVRIANSALTVTRTGGSIEIGLHHADGTQVASHCETHSSLVTTAGTASTVLISAPELDGMASIQCVVTSTARAKISGVKVRDVKIDKSVRTPQDHMWMLVIALLSITAVMLSVCYRAGFLIRRYDRWVRNWSKEIEEMLTPLKANDPIRYIEVLRAISDGRTRDMFTIYPDIYRLPEKPPNLWNSRARLASAINLTVLLLSANMCVIVVVTI